MEKQFPINLGIKPEINTIYEGHQEVLNLSLTEWLFHGHPHWIIYKTLRTIDFLPLTQFLCVSRKEVITAIIAL